MAVVSSNLKKDEFQDNFILCGASMMSHREPSEKPPQGVGFN
jgi:hypothetical protein